MPGINSLLVMCKGIIRNNSLVGGRARADTERVTSTAHGGRMR